MSEKRIRNNRDRRRKELRMHIIISVFTLCIVFWLALGFFSLQTDAKDSYEAIEFKYYTSIVIANGDTLWDIASRHMGSHYGSEAEYIEEVMRINSLRNENIYAGEHLIIPYYSQEVLH